MRLTAAQVADADAMALLLWEWHRDHAPLGATHVFADRDRAAAAVARTLAAGPCVLAFDSRGLAGWMATPMPLRPGPTAARFTTSQFAVRPDAGRAACRSLYGAVGGELVAAGITHHSLPVRVDEPAVVDALFELEFGIDQIDGIVPVAVDAAASTAGPARFATPDDLDRIIELALELVTFHSRPPMFQPALTDLAGLRRGAARDLENESSAVVVVEEAGRIVALAQAGPAAAYLDTVDIGLNVVTETARGTGRGTLMLEFILVWAARRGYQYCTVGWTSSNPISDPFYRSRGFQPVRYRLHRRIDPRVLWANERLDYRPYRNRLSAFPPSRVE